MNNDKTGRFIADLRREKQFTQAQLADAIHVSDKAVSRWETGRGFPDIDNLEALSECLDVSIAELIKGERINAPVSGAELNDIASDGLSLTRSLIAKRKITSTLLGFVLGLIIIIIAVIHMMSPIYIKDSGNALTVEELSDGSIVAVLGGNVSGYDIDRFKDQDSSKTMAFIGCYRTRWDQLSRKSNETLVRISGLLPHALAAPVPLTSSSSRPTCRVSKNMSLFAATMMTVAAVTTRVSTHLVSGVMAIFSCMKFTNRWKIIQARMDRSLAR